MAKVEYKVVFSNVNANELPDPKKFDRMLEHNGVSTSCTYTIKQIGYDDGQTLIELRDKVTERFKELFGEDAYKKEEWFIMGITGERSNYDYRKKYIPWLEKHLKKNTPIEDIIQELVEWISL